MANLLHKCLYFVQVSTCLYITTCPPDSNLQPPAGPAQTAATLTTSRKGRCFTLLPRTARIRESFAFSDSPPLDWIRVAWGILCYIPDFWPNNVHIYTKQM